MSAGRVVLVGMGADDYALPISYIQNMELIVTGVFRYTNTWPLAIAMLESGAVELDSLVTHEYGLDQVEQALDADASPTSLKRMVLPSVATIGEPDIATRAAG